MSEERPPVWTSEERKGVTVKIGEKTIFIEGSLTAEKVREIAKNEGLVNFVVRDESGRYLAPDDFPIDSGTITIEEYTEGA